MKKIKERPLGQNTRFKEIRELARKLRHKYQRDFKASTGKSNLLLKRDDGLEISIKGRSYDRLCIFYDTYDKLIQLDFDSIIQELDEWGVPVVYDAEKEVYHYKNNTGLVASIQPKNNLFVVIHTTYGIPEPINYTHEFSEAVIWASLVKTDIELKDNREWYYDRQEND